MACVSYNKTKIYIYLKNQQCDTGHMAFGQKPPQIMSHLSASQVIVNIAVQDIGHNSSINKECIHNTELFSSYYT